MPCSGAHLAAKFGNCAGPCRQRRPHRVGGGAGSTPPETKSLGPVAAAPKADDDQAIDPSSMTALMEAIDQIEARVSACEAARNV